MNMPTKLKYLIVNGTIILVLFTLLTSLRYLSSPPKKPTLEKQFFKDLKSDRDRIAQELWRYHAENGRYPEDLTKVNVTLKVSSIEKWHFSENPHNHFFAILIDLNESGKLIGKSYDTGRIKWDLWRL